MQDEFDGTDSAVSMITTIVISPEKLVVGGIQHNNNWPAIEAH